MSGDVGDQSAAAWEVPAADAAHQDPLLDCLVLLTKAGNRPFSADALTAGLPLVDNRLTPKLFVRAAERAGLRARIVKRPLKQISKLVLPAVLLLKGRQACVLLEYDESTGQARILQPETGGESKVKLSHLDRVYTGYAIYVQPEYRFDERAPEVLEVRSRHWFWGTLMSSWRIYRDVLAASFLINVFAVAGSLFIMNVYDRVVPNKAMETLWVLAIGVGVVYVFDFMLRGLRGYFIDIAGRKADVILSARIFEKVLGLKMAARPVSVGAFANNLREFDSIRDFITSATITTLIDLPFVVLFVAVIAFIGGPVAFVPAFGIPLIAIYGFVVQPSLRKAVEHVFRASAEKNATLVESLTGVETLKAMGAESPVQHKWEQAAGFIAQWGVRSRLLSASAVNVAVFVQQLAMIGVVIVGVYQITQAELSMGGLIACVILTGRALAPMAQVASLATRNYQARAALDTLNKIMALPGERPEGKNFVRRPRFKGHVEFSGVTFSYPEQSMEALRKISFSVQPGEHVAIIGRIGSGKTTLEKLILGLYDPAEGAVRIDGIDVRQIDPADLRRNIGYVPQDVVLFYGTLRDNIVLGAPYAEDEAVLRAATIAGVKEFADRHPMGFDMPVGERGEGLSGGQRQAVAVARALLMEPSILLLDEPTNSMDNTSEQLFKLQLSKIVEGRTLVLVTHRASLLDLVGRVIVMDNGQIVADGPKAQVLEALKQGKLRTARV